MQGRLGINVHRDAWPTVPVLRRNEAAGFGWVQVHSPPIAAVTDREGRRRHARALRAILSDTALSLVLHGPDELCLGDHDHDRAFEGLLDYAAEAGAAFVVYHGLNLPERGARCDAEEVALRRMARRAEALGVTIAVENLAPVWPGPPRLCHDPLAVRDLVREVTSPAVGLLLDLGHAHIAANIARGDLAGTVRAVAAEVVLFHVHDNLGARRNDLGAPGVDPLKLDLHLPPGVGTLPWDQVATQLCAHTAPLMLEVERSHVGDVEMLATVTRGLLGRGAPAFAAA